MLRRKRLEKEILEISEREQTRIGRELHDSLGQQLTGVAIMSKVLQQRLDDPGPGGGRRAGELVQLISRAIEETRQLSRGLHPVSLDENGLMAALQSLAAATESIAGIPCSFPVRQAGPGQRYVHGGSSLPDRPGGGLQRHSPRAGQTDRHCASPPTTAGPPCRSSMTAGVSKRLPKKRGMGLQVMGYRAEVIGGILNVQQGPAGGTRSPADLM